MQNNNIIQFPKLKIANDDFEVEYEIEARVNDEIDERSRRIKQEMDELNKKLSFNQYQLDSLNDEINRFTNHTDGLDYLVAVGSGILAAMIDVIWVGKFDLNRGREWGSDRVNDFVIRVAELTGYEGTDLEKAIEHLESNFGAPSDSNTMDFGGALQHHLRDFAHHPTPVGLMFSLLTQFTGKAYGTDEFGVFKIVDVKNKSLIGKSIPEKILIGVVHWFFHMVSDMAGSSSSPGNGTGLPGPLLSLAKELSALPFFKNIKLGDEKFSVWISKLFNGTLLAERNEDGTIKQPLRFDLRAEIGLGYEIGRQALPILINEIIIRGFYFIRRFAQEIKEKNVEQLKDLKFIDWKNTLPFKNRTIIRMLTISTATFTSIDLVDAAIRGLYNSKGNKALFLTEFILHVNFVGVGRFSVALGSDVVMGIKKQKLSNERMGILAEQLHLLNSKIFYTQAGAWIAAETTEKTINEALVKMEKTTRYFRDTWKANKDSLENISSYRKGIVQHNPNLIDDISDILKWG